MDNFKFVESSNSDPEFIRFCEQLDVEQDAMWSERRNKGISSLKDLQRVTDVLFLKDKDVPVGCIALIPKSPEVAIICRVILNPDYRGRGLAKVLITEIEKVAKRKGANRAVARIIISNVASIASFKSLGYVEDNTANDDCEKRIYVTKNL